MPDRQQLPGWCAMDTGLAVAKIGICRVPDAAGRLARAIGVPAPAPNRYAAADNLMLAAVAPDEWLLTGTRDRIAAALAHAEAAFPTEPVLALDVTDGVAALRLEGAAALDCLAAFTPLDLRPDSFPVHAAVRTRFADIGVFVAHLDDAPRLLLICDQSYAGYLVHLIAQDARAD